MEENQQQAPPTLIGSQWTGFVAAEPTKNSHGVSINKVENGFLIAVGCKTFVAKTFEELSEGLALYYKNPKAAQERYCTK